MHRISKKHQHPDNSEYLVIKSPVFYGWVIAFAGTLGMILSSPGLTYSVSIFTEHFIHDLGISRSLVSTLYTGGTLVASLVLPLVGRQIDRRGSRIMVGIIGALLGLTCIYMGLVQNVGMIAIGFIALRLFGQGSMNMVSQNVINQWWVRRRGMIMGGTVVLSSLLGMGSVPNLINWMIPMVGWRNTFMLMGAAILLVFAPLEYFLFRNQPEMYHLKPDGIDEDELLVDLEEEFHEENWTLSEALHTSAFWVLTISMSVITMLMAGMLFHLVSLFADNGLDSTVAASIYLPMSITTAAVALAGGFLADRFPVKNLLSVGLIILAASLFLACNLKGVELAILFGVLMGVISGLNRMASSVVYANYFGRRDLGSIIGAASMVTVLGSAFGPMPLGIARDRLGSYNSTLMIASIIPIVLAVACWFVRTPKKTA